MGKQRNTVVHPEKLTNEQFAALGFLDQKRAVNALIRTVGQSVDATPERTDAVLHVSDAILREQTAEGIPQDWGMIQDSVVEQFTGEDEDYFLYALIEVPESMTENPDSDD